VNVSVELNRSAEEFVGGVSSRVLRDLALRR
jgi:hypothetical protein